MSKSERDEAVRNFRPGIYRHYKGGLYRALFLAADHESREPVVVYTSMKQGSVNVRPLAGPEGWNTQVAVQGLPGPVVNRARFELIYHLYALSGRQ